MRSNINRKGVEKYLHKYVFFKNALSGNIDLILMSNRTENVQNVTKSTNEKEIKL